MKFYLFRSGKCKITTTLMVNQIPQMLLRKDCMRAHNVHFLKEDMSGEDEKKSKKQTSEPSERSEPSETSVNVFCYVEAIHMEHPAKGGKSPYRL